MWPRPMAAAMPGKEPAPTPNPWLLGQKEPDQWLRQPKLGGIAPMWPPGLAAAPFRARHGCWRKHRPASKSRERHSGFVSRSAPGGLDLSGGIRTRGINRRKANERAARKGLRRNLRARSCKLTWSKRARAARTGRPRSVHARQTKELGAGAMPPPAGRGLREAGPQAVGLVRN